MHRRAPARGRAAARGHRDRRDSGSGAVRVVVTDGGARTWLDVDDVLPGDVLEIDAAALSASRLGDNTVVSVFDSGGTEVQTIEMVTSCREPLNLEDRFGSIVGDDASTTFARLQRREPNGSPLIHLWFFGVFPGEFILKISKIRNGVGRHFGFLNGTSQVVH